MGAFDPDAWLAGKKGQPAPDVTTATEKPVEPFVPCNPCTP